MKLESLIAAVFVIAVVISTGGFLYLMETTPGTIHDYYNYYDDQCADRLGEEWHSIEVLAPPNQDKQTATVRCVKGKWFSSGDTVTIETTPYSSKTNKEEA